MMPNLTDDPYFDGQAVINRVRNLWMQLMLCRYSGDLEPLKPYFSEELYLKETNAVSRDRAAGQARCAGRPAILNGSLEIAPVSGGKEILVCRLMTRYTPEIRRPGSDEVIKGGKETFFHEAWRLTRPAGTKTPKPGAAFAVNCPNCGAPFSMYKTAKCPMCGSLIPVPDFVWTVDSIG